jgi:hypothetical protein
MATRARVGEWRERSEEEEEEEVVVVVVGSRVGRGARDGDGGD